MKRALFNRQGLLCGSVSHAYVPAGSVSSYDSFTHPSVVVAEVSPQEFLSLRVAVERLVWERDQAVKDHQALARSITLHGSIMVERLERGT